jgi:hypothetical protein
MRKAVTDRRYPVTRMFAHCDLERVGRHIDWAFVRATVQTDVGKVLK